LQEVFYEKFYGMCTGHEGFHALLRQKETFLRTACEEIIRQTLGTH